MNEIDYADCLKNNFLEGWINIYKFRKPLIAAVNGYAVTAYII